MIFVTVGTHTQGFDRLVKAADEFAAMTDEQVVVQRGSSLYQPVAAVSFQWASSDEIEARMRAARVVVAHAGAGTIIQVFQVDRPLIIVPRLRRFGENSNDHQRQLAQALDVQGRAVILEEVNRAGLQRAIENVPRLEKVRVNPDQLVAALRNRLALWSEERAQSFKQDGA
jgi:UDP-N-acetylglucosamine transferase subunit ALG13